MFWKLIHKMPYSNSSLYLSCGGKYILSCQTLNEPKCFTGYIIFNVSPWWQETTLSNVTKKKSEGGLCVSVCVSEFHDRNWNTLHIARYGKKGKNKGKVSTMESDAKKNESFPCLLFFLQILYVVFSIDAEQCGLHIFLYINVCISDFGPGWWDACMVVSSEYVIGIGNKELHGGTRIKCWAIERRALDSRKSV